MAEKSFQTPQHFLEYVVQPNLEDFRANSACLKTAFNSVMCIDALAAHMFLHTSERNGAKDDSAYRQFLANENESFNLVRDVAKSFKHVELVRHNPVVKKAEQTHVGKRPFGMGLFGVGSYSGDEVMVELETHDVKHLVSEAILATQYLAEKMKEEQ